MTTMDDIREVSISKCENSRFVRILRLNYEQDGKPRDWDIIIKHDGVYIIIYNTTRKKLVLVKQFRPGSYFAALRKNQPNEDICIPGAELDISEVPGEKGVALELCAGMMDKRKPPVECARDEVLEECGYKVPLKKFQKILTTMSSTRTASHVTYFYVEVTDEMRVSSGGGLEEEGEFIEVVEMSIAEVEELLQQDAFNTASGTLFGLTWFLLHKRNSY